MKAEFLESAEFTEWIGDHLPDDEYSRLQHELMENPTKGVVIPGCNGLRKVRTSDPQRGRGKRGGARVIYLFVPEAKWFYMIDVYGKDEKDDLSADEKKGLSNLADAFRREAIAAVERRTKGKK